MRRSLLISSLIAVIVGAVLQGSARHHSLLFDVTLNVTVPLGVLVVLAGAGAIVRGKSQMPNFCEYLTKALLVVGSATIISACVGGWFHDYQVSAVKKYVLKAVPILGDIRKRDGKFPDQLPVDVLGKPPKLITSDRGYSSDGSSYTFRYQDRFFDSRQSGWGWQYEND